MMGPRAYGGVVAVAPAIPPLSPAQIGATYHLYSGDTASVDASLTVTSGNVASAADHAGGGFVLTGTACPYKTTSPGNTNARGTTRARIDVNPLVNSGAKLVGTALFGGLTNFTAPWSVVMSVRFEAQASSGSSGDGGLANGMFTMGPTGAGANNCVSMGCTSSTPPGTVGTFGTYQCLGTINAPFGSATLANGTAGSTVPSYQVLAMVHATDPIDGLWYISFYIDGKFISRTAAYNSGNTSGTGYVLASDAWGVVEPLPGFYHPPEYSLFDLAVWTRALNPAEVRSVSAWCIAETGALATGISVTGGIDSISAGYGATTTSLGYFNILAATYAALYPSAAPVVAANVAITSTTLQQWQSGIQPYFPLIANAVAPRSVPNDRILVLLGGTNDVNLIASPTATIIKNAQSLIARAFAGGYGRVILVGITPWDHAGMGTTFTTAALALAAAQAATNWGPNVTFVYSLNTSDTTPVPGYPGNGAPAATRGGLRAIVAASTFVGGVHPDTPGHAALSWDVALAIGPLT